MENLVCSFVNADERRVGGDRKIEKRRGMFLRVDLERDLEKVGQKIGRLAKVGTIGNGV